MDSGRSYRRDESEAERLDRNYGELLQELRVAQAGVQILFAFLLTIAFQPRFAELDGFQRTVYLVTLLCSALAVCCFVAPVAAHRMMFRRGVKDELVAFTSRMAAAGLWLLALAVVGGVLLVVELVTSRSAALIAAGGLALVGAVLWVAVPLRLRPSNNQRPSDNQRPPDNQCPSNNQDPSDNQS